MQLVGAEEEPLASSPTKSKAGVEVVECISSSLSDLVSDHSPQSWWKLCPSPWTLSSTCPVPLPSSILIQTLLEPPAQAAPMQALSGPRIVTSLQVTESRIVVFTARS